MSKPDIDPKLEPKEKTQPAAPMVDAEGLRELIAAAVAAAVAGATAVSQQNSESLVSALLQSQRPFVDPKDEANQKAIRESDDRAREQRESSVKRSQEMCPHMMGSHPLSQFPGLMSCVARHRLDTGQAIGICLNCGRRWFKGDADYDHWMWTVKSGQTMSEAGRRYY